MKRGLTKISFFDFFLEYQNTLLIKIRVFELAAPKEPLS